MRPQEIEFSFHVGLFFKSIKVVRDGDDLHCSFSSLGIKQEKILKGEKAARWMERFDVLPIGQWKRQYALPYPVLDGFSWALVLRESGKKRRKWEGSNVEPPLWEAFLFLFDEVFPQAELFSPGCIDRLTIDYKGRGHKEHLELELIILSMRYAKEQGMESENHVYFGREEVKEALSCLREVLGKIKGTTGPCPGPKVTLEVFPHRGKRFVIESPYDRLSLPEEWNDVMAHLWPLGIRESDIMDSSVYGHGVREGELIYIGVRFSKGGTLYHYRINEDDLYVGDWIIVPVGNEGGEKALAVETVGYYRPGDEPFPYELTKEVIAKTENEPCLVPCPLLDGQNLSDLTCGRVKKFFLGKEGNVPSWVYGISHKEGKETCLSCSRYLG